MTETLTRPPDTGTGLGKPWHVIVLNTECVGVSACSVPDQLTWARADLDDIAKWANS